eukprot:5010553-Pleurochrysis_carterae.AAC.2
MKQKGKVVGLDQRSDGDSSAADIGPERPGRARRGGVLPQRDTRLRPAHGMDASWTLCCSVVNAVACGR